MTQDLDFYISQIGDARLRKVCGHLKDYPNFFTWPGAVGGQHHAYENGLLIHTLEVVDYALKISEFLPDIKKDILIAGALWHDWGKIFDYQLISVFTGQNIPRVYVEKERFEGGCKVWTYAPYGQKVHHITGSSAEFTAHALNKLPRETINDVVHLIVSHHGPKKEWGSPREPQTPEAHILHAADTFSARCGPTVNHPPKQ